LVAHTIKCRWAMRRRWRRRRRKPPRTARTRAKLMWCHASYISADDVSVGK
jgi:hypothetical protein